MLATGGSASKAIEILLENKVPEEKMIFVNLVASRAGIDVLVKAFPKMRIVTAAVDEALSASK